MRTAAVKGAARVGLGMALALAAVAGAPAQAQDERVLVSNAGFSGGGNGYRAHVGVWAGIRTSRAQSFATGDNAAGYGLASVALDLAEFPDGAAVSVGIHDDSSGAPGTEVVSLTAPASIAADALNTFVAPGNPTVAADTTYWIVVRNPGTAAFDLATWWPDGEEAGKASGWSIGDEHLQRDDDSGWTGTSSDAASLKVAVRGTVREPPPGGKPGKDKEPPSARGTPQAAAYTLASNAGEARVGGGSDRFGADSFRTGDAATGYVVTEVRVRANSYTDGTTVLTIRDDDNGAPGDVVATLGNPASSAGAAVNTFTVPDGTVLEGGTTYWLYVNDDVASDRWVFHLTALDDETSDFDWTIGDGSLAKSALGTTGPVPLPPCWRRSPATTSRA